MSETEDLWERARASTQADVAAALAQRERRCPRCGASQRSSVRTCTSCGGELSVRFAARRSRRPLVVTTLVVLALVAVGIPVFSGLRDEAAKERARAAQRQEALDAAGGARLPRAPRPVRARGPRPAAGAAPLAHR